MIPIRVISNIFSNFAMLCEVCNTINIDDLIPLEIVDNDLVISGTTHHASFAGLKSAAERGCELCKAIEACAIDLIKQPVLLKRLSSNPVEFKLRRKGRNNPGYQGGCKLWVSCEGKIIAQLEAYLLRGIDSSAIDDRVLTLDRIRGC
jgi:hypothetical protein